MSDGRCDRLLKGIARLGRAAVDPTFVGIDPCIAVGPTQEKRRSQWKNNGLAAELRLNAHTLRSGGQSEGESLAEDDRVGPMFHLTDHGTKYLGFEQERGGVGPIAGRGRDVPAALRELIGINSCEGAGAGNA
jgi:hypothetical protein